MHSKPRIFTLSSLLVLVSCFVHAQEKANEYLIEGIPGFIEELMEEWDVPGLAVAIVKDGEVILSQGFGFRDVEQKLGVTPDTLFAIGSTTKAFTSLAVGMLVDEGKLEWDEPVINYLKDFRLQDEYATAHLTPRDLVTHRSGLPRHDLMWYGSPFDRKELYKRLRYLEFSAEPRVATQYNNLMFMTTGYLVGRISGGTWEEFIKGRIFDPLGMERSNFSVTVSQRDSDFAQPYVRRDEKITKVPFRSLDSIGPAGSINSSISEMSRWLLLHINKGKVGETQLVSEATISLTHSPQVVLPAGASKELPMTSYGMGWVIQPYRGHLLVWHNGGIDGFYSFIGFLPYDNLGIVILTNRSGNPLPEIISRRIFDREGSLEEIDWNARFIEQRDKARAAQEQAEGEKDTRRKEGTSPSHALADYVGSYEHKGYGVVEVALDGDKLTAAVNGMTAGLEHFHYDVFRTKHALLDGLKIRFNLDVNGEIESLSTQLQQGVDDIIFNRLPDTSALADDMLKKIAGEYDYMGMIATIELRENGELVAIVPGQGTFVLVLYRGTEFELQGVDGVSVEFKFDDDGNVTEAVVYQPDGTFIAKRVE